MHMKKKPIRKEIKMKLTKELIEKMKTNNTNWYYLDDEMKEAFRVVPRAKINMWEGVGGRWVKCRKHWALANQYIYRLDKNFELPTEPKKKLVSYDVKPISGRYYASTHISMKSSLIEALNTVGCVGVSYKEDLSRDAIHTSFPMVYHAEYGLMSLGLVIDAAEQGNISTATPDKVWFFVEDGE